MGTSVSSWQPAKCWGNVELTSIPLKRIVSDAPCGFTLWIPELSVGLVSNLGL